MSDEPSTRASATASRWRSSGWWYLAFLLNLVFQPLFDPDTRAVSWIAAIVAIAVFVPLFLRVTMVGGAIARWSPHLTAALGLLVFPFNGGATVFAVYAAAFAGFQASRRVAYRWFTGISGGTLALALFVPMELPVALTAFGFPALLVWVVGLMTLEEADRDREAARLRIDNARIEHLATATERERLARDLHDLLGQSLTEVIVRAQLVRRLAATDPQRAATEAEEIERSSRRALDEVRQTVRGWSEVRLEEELEAALRSLDAAAIEPVVDRDPAFDPPPTTETALALALREATTNVVRHAAATRCTLRFQREDGYDVLCVADDGVGGPHVEGSGLSGMRERILAIGGTVERDDAAGTTVTLRTPAGIPA